MTLRDLELEGHFDYCKPLNFSTNKQKLAVVGYKLFKLN